MIDLQHAQAQRVEGADRQPFGTVAADALGDAFAHLLGGLVGEGDRGDALGRHACAGNQVRDLFHDHPRLAAARASEHEQGTVRMQDSSALRRVETVHAKSSGSEPIIRAARGAIGTD